jgi:hypothetical protein
MLEKPLRLTPAANDKSHIWGRKAWSDNMLDVHA